MRLLKNFLMSSKKGKVILDSEVVSSTTTNNDLQGFVFNNDLNLNLNLVPETTGISILNIQNNIENENESEIENDVVIKTIFQKEFSDYLLESEVINYEIYKQITSYDFVEFDLWVKENIFLKKNDLLEPIIRNYFDNMKIQSDLAVDNYFKTNWTILNKLEKKLKDKENLEDSLVSKENVLSDKGFLLGTFAGIVGSLSLFAVSIKYYLSNDDGNENESSDFWKYLLLINAFCVTSLGFKTVNDKIENYNKLEMNQKEELEQINENINKLELESKSSQNVEILKDTFFSYIDEQSPILKDDSKNQELYGSLKAMFDEIDIKEDDPESIKLKISSNLEDLCSSIIKKLNE